MKLIRCEMCGGTDLIKQDGVFVCQNCGIKYSVEEAKKLMVEGMVSIDRSAEIANLLLRAAQFEKNQDYKKAMEYCEKVLDIDANNSEAIEGFDRLKILSKRPINNKCKMCGATVSATETSCHCCGYSW